MTEILKNAEGNKMLIKRKSIITGTNGIEIFDGYEKHRLNWKEIIGINGNKKRGEIYTRKGKIIKFNYKLFHTLDYEILDYEKNQIGEGDPFVIRDWQDAYSRIKSYIKERGGTYIKELEGLYNLWGSLVQIGGFRDMNFPKEEIQDKKIIIIGIAVSFLYWFVLFIWGAVIGNKINDQYIGYSITIFGILLWGFIMFMAIYTKRSSKLKNILERNQLFIGET
jgi:hypothetical protein